MRRTSLRGQLLAWVLLPLLPLAALDSWLSYRSATETATEIFDRMLLGSARIIGEQVRVEDGVPQSYIPPAALELFESIYRDRVYYRVEGADGRLILGYAEMPMPAQRLAEEEVAHFDANFRGEPLRVVAYAQPVFGAPALNPVLIEVGQTLNAPSELAFAIWSRSVGKHVLLAIALAGLLFLGLRRGLAPLVALSEHVERRVPGSLEKIEGVRAPRELEPLIQAINDYVRRLDDHMSAHSRFIANASHQLRTPLTVLNTQIAYALRAFSVLQKDDALRAIQESCHQGIRVVRQLLAMSVAEARGEPRPGELVDLVAVVRATMEHQAGFAQTRNIDLGCEMPEHAIVAGDESLLRELVGNLLDNALRYSNPGGAVTLYVRPGESGTSLLIEDDGPGIAPEERERVFDRFYRVHNDTSDGCGLGLAIVREVADSMGARIHLRDPEHHRGLVVTLEFPAVPPPRPAAMAA